MTETIAMATAMMPTAQNQSELLSLCSYSQASHSILNFKDGLGIVIQKLYHENFVAEGGGLEPPRAIHPLVFKTSAIPLGEPSNRLFIL